MKTVFALSALLFFLGTTYAFAGQFGPAEAQVSPGQFSLGAGAFRYSDKWDFEKFTTDANQTQFFVQADVGLYPSTEAYLRIGGADAGVDDALGGSNFRGGYAPYGTLGLKGLFHRGKYLDVGGFVEGSYFGSYSDSTPSAKLNLDKAFAVNAGLTFEKEIEGACLYAGPFFHYRKGDFSYADRTDATNNFSGSAEEDNKIGGFLGIRWIAMQDIVVELETQLRNNLSFGGGISFIY